MKLIRFFSLYTLLLLLATSLPAQIYTVTFLASHPMEGGISPGHIWVKLSDGNSSQTWGFYPDSLKNDTNRRSDVDYKFSTDKAGYERALQVVSQFQGRDYDFGTEDCRFFASNIARAIGLRTPSLGTKSPGEWLGDLVEMNF
jgi:hypothetical protein